MAFEYLLYDEGRQKLDAAGLTSRIQKAVKQPDFPFPFDMVGEDDVPGWTADLKERGYSKAIPQELKGAYFAPLKEAFQKLKEHQWVVKRQKGEVREEASYEDFMFLTGYLASFVLKPKEFWDFKAAGFSSVFDFFGTIGACAFRACRDDFRIEKEGYVWNSEADGKKFVTGVTGDSDGDFRLYRTDITPYETIDPLGNRVLYRPELKSDKQVVAAYHSVEPALLVALLKYVDQEHIASEVLTDKGIKELAGKINKIGQEIGPFGDFGDDNNGRLSLAHYFVPLPKLGEREHNPYCLSIQSEGVMGIYVGERGLAFEYVPDAKGGQRELVFELPAGEVDQLIKGLFVQAAKGLGRTSVVQLVNLLKCRFSPEFEGDQKRFAR